MQATTGAASVGALVSAASATGGAGAATRLALIAQNCQQGGGDREFSRALHPLQFRLHGSHAMGAVVGNFIIVCGFALFGLLAWQIGSHALRTLSFQSRFATPMDIQGFFRFPSAPFILIMWLYQGTALGSLLLIFYPPSFLGWVVGVVGNIVLVMIPIWALLVVEGALSTNPNRRAVYVEIVPEKWRLLVEYVVGKGEWVSTGREVNFVYRYSSLIRPYREEALWWGAIEFASSFALAGMSALPTGTVSACGHVRLFSALIFGLLLAAEATVQPHVRPRDNFVDITLIVLQIAALLLLAASLYLDDPTHWTAEVAEAVLFSAAALMMMKIVLDVLSEAYVLYHSRRSRLQNELWDSKAVGTPSDSNTEPTSSFMQPSDLPPPHRRVSEPSSPLLCKQPSNDDFIRSAPLPVRHPGW
eukprot:gene15061-biopygen15139